MAPDNQLVSAIAKRLVERGFTLVTAESCTGGLIASELTGVPGCTDWFEGGFVTYRLSAKTGMLGVREETLDTCGAVSEPTAREMAEGALTHSTADISLSVTGIAGPEGGDVLNPVGTVWFGWALRVPEPRCVQTSRHEFSGDRDSVREQALQVSLEGLLEILRDP